MTSRVFLIAQPTVKRNGELPDLTPLHEHGDIIILIETGVYPSNNPTAALDLIEKRLESFDYEKDSIAWAGGDTLSAVLTGVILWSMEIPYFHYLRFDRDRDDEGNRLFTGHYTKIRVDLDEVNVSALTGE